MDRPSRPPNRPHGRPDLTTATTQETGGGPQPVGAAGASPQAPRASSGGERRCGQPEASGAAEADSQSRCRPRTVPPFEGLGVFHSRSIFHLPRRSSSGYFSSDGDSLPSSPLSPKPVTADKATQTPSPTGQLVQHALQRLAEVPGRGVRTQQPHGSHLSPFSAQHPTAAGDMQAVEVGRELRRIGDDFNNHLLDVAGRHRWVVIQPIRVPHIHQDPAVLLCVGLLLFVIGRILYSQGSVDSQPQV